MAYISVSVDASEFEDDDLIVELESRGYQCIKTGIDSSAMAPDFERIEHLVVCGQMAEARIECLTMVGEAIGRRLM